MTATLALGSMHAGVLAWPKTLVTPSSVPSAPHCGLRRAALAGSADEDMVPRPEQPELVKFGYKFLEVNMLHMVVIEHGPDTCAAVHSEMGGLARSARTQMDETSSRLGIKVQGWWVDPPAHVFYMLADAPNAHVINNLMTELRLFHWNTIDIHPIMTIDEAMPLAAS